MRMVEEVLRPHLEAGRSLPEILATVAARSDEGMVFLGRDGERSLLYGDLYARSRRMALRLLRHGLQKGDPAILLFDDERELVLAFWGVLLAGGVAVPLSPPSSAGDEAFRKILAVHAKCAARSGRPPLVLSDLDFDAFAEAGSFTRETFLDTRLLQEDAGDDGALLAPEVREGDLAILMFSSGSTGDAKGVRLTHRQILSNLVQLCERSELTSADRSLSWLPLTHDMGLVLFHLCHTLAGIPQYKMTPLAFARAPADLLDHAGKHRISVLGMPNFGFDLLLRTAKDAPEGRWSLSPVRLVYNGAEPIDPQLCRRFAERFASFGLRPHVVNPGWGIAEASVAASGFPHRDLPRHGGIPSLWVSALEGMAVGRPIRVAAPGSSDAREVVALGPPMSGMRIRALDDSGQELPASCLGHLEIQGPNVTRGYYDGPDAEWCATGDIGFLHEGLVYLTGRAKDVIFLNGRNHFSNDIETALCQKLGWPANQLAVVGSTDPGRRIERVVVFFRPMRGTDRRQTAEEMRRALEGLLAHPVAGAIALPALPKTTSGKIRRFELRQALLRGEHDAALAAQEQKSSRSLSPAEAEIAQAVREIVSCPDMEIDPEVPLSRHGLDSVGFLQLASRLSARTGRQVALHEMIRAGSVSGIVPLIDRASPSSTAPAMVTGMRVPLTARQGLLWTAFLLDPGSRAYNETYWLRLEGALDEERFVAAARQVIACHPMLHAVVDDSRGLELVLRAARDADVERLSCAEGEVDPTIEGLAAHAFDLRRGPLLRLRLVAAGRSHVLFLSAHHIVTDGWSLQGLISQIFDVYAGSAVPPVEDDLWFEPPRFAAEELRALRSRLDACEPIQLPRGSSRAGPGRTGIAERTLAAPVSRAVRDWQLRRGSEFSALAAALAALLGRLAGVRRPLLGTVASGRNDGQAQSRAGYFARTLALPVDLVPGATFTSLVEALEPARLRMLAGEMPDIAELESNAGGIGQAVRVVYVHQNMPAIALPDDLFVSAQGRCRGPARVDLVVSSSWKEDRLVLHWEYDEDRFGAAQVEGYAELFEHVLGQVLAAPGRQISELDLLSPAQRALYRPYRDTEVSIDLERDLVARFEAMADAQRGLTALSDGTSRYSYRELLLRVDALCWKLDQLEIERGDRIALLTDRSADYVIGLLATLKMAATAIPIDPALPRERIEHILRETSAALVLTTPGVPLDEAFLSRYRTFSFHAEGLAALQRHPGRRRTPDDTAYLIFTSGSTGKPKGVTGSHRALTNLADWVVKDFGYRPGEIICQFAPFSFDVSLAEILPSLAAGLHVHVLPAARRSSPDLYLETLREERVNVATVTPAYLSVLNELPERCRESLGHLRLLILGGEALRSCDVRRFREHSPHVEIVNVYGPTETTVLSSAYQVPRMLSPGREWQPLGLPIANTEMWVLDDEGRVCPGTVTGTLHIGGEGLSRGYWKDVERTEAAFRMLSPDGLAKRRFYCTGDLARIAPDGELEFVGRRDTQIKLRGFRIELGEIESALEQHPGVQKAVVVALAREGAERVLVAYHSGDASGGLDVFLRERLPAYMVPGLYVHLAEWPLTESRKVDRNRLPPPRFAPAAEDAPVGETERRLAEIWAGILGCGGVRRTDDFRLLGGSSLNLAQLVNRIRERFGRELRMKDAMRASTLEGMARVIDEAPEPARPAPVRRQRVAGTPMPASEAQARMVFLDRAHPGTPLNNIPLTLRLGAAPDASRLEAAVGELSRRHEMLRSRLRAEPEGVVQLFDANLPRLEILRGTDKADALRLLERFHREPFALDEGPLWRVALVTAGDEAWLALCMHHAIADGVTLVRMLADLDAFYQGLPLVPIGEELSYPDYVAWQRELLGSATGEEAARFWTDEARRRPLPDLPHARGGREDVRGRQFAVGLDERETAILKSICGQQGVSPFVLLTTLFGFAIGQRCKSQCFAVGVTLSGRSHRALESVPGLFVNTLPLAFDWSGRDRFGELLSRVKLRVSELQDVQDFPLNRVLAAQGRTDLPFNILFNEEVLPRDLSFAGGSATLEGVSTGIAKLPLLVSFLIGDSTWGFRMECRAQGCPPEWVSGLVQDVSRLLKALDGMSDARLDALESADEQLIALLNAS